MRWRYLLPRAVILLLLWAFFTWAFDPLLQRGLVVTGEKAARAKVDIAEVRTAFYPPAVVVEGVQIANRDRPGTNLVEFDQLKLNLAGGPLLKKRFVVEQGEITGLEWGTLRGDSGLLDGDAGDAGDSLDLSVSWADEAERLGREWLDTLIAQARMELDPRQLQTVQVSEAVSHEWKTRFDGYEQRVETFEQRVKALEDLVKNAKGEPLERFEAYRAAAQEVRDLLTEADRTRGELEQLARLPERDFQRIERARQNDLERIRRRVELFTELDPHAISEALLGPEMTARLEQALLWAQWARRQYESVPDPTEPVRLRGVDVVFPVFDERPAFVAEQLRISGAATFDGERLPFQGTITGLTSDPALYGRPVVVSIDARGQNRVRLEVALDHTTDQPVHDVSLVCTVPRPQPLEIGKDGSVQFHIAAEQAEWTADLRHAAHEISGRVVLTQRSVTASAELGRHDQEDARRILRNALSEIRDVRTVVEVSGPATKPEWRLTSNLGDQIVAGLNAVVAQEIALHQETLTRKLDELAREEMTELDELLAERFNDLSEKLQLNEASAREMIDRVAARDGDVRRILQTRQLPPKIDGEMRQQLEEEQRKLQERLGKKNPFRDFLPR